MRRSGFTFIELLTVVAIIAILAAILFPVFARAREKSRQANCALNLHNIGMAARIYSSEHFGHFPPTDNDLWPLVPKYIADAEVMICPTVPSALHAAETITGGRFDPDTVTPPGRVGDPPDKLCDYIYRGGLCDDDHPSEALAGDDVADRHNDGANYLFLDGHTRWMRGSSFRSLTQTRGIEELRSLGVPMKDENETPGSLPSGPLS